MALPDLDVARIRRYVAERNAAMPSQARDQVRLECDVDARSVTVVECRPPWDGVGIGWTRFVIVKLRYSVTRGEWELAWRDRNETFHRYDPVEPTPDVAALLAEVDRDPTGIFWG